MPDITTPATIKTEQREIAVRAYVEALSDVTKLLPHPSKVLSNIGKTIDVFDITSKQPDVAAVARRVRDGIKKLDWDVSHVSNRGERALFFKAFCRALNLNHIIEKSVSARDYGYTVFEVTWAVIDGKYVITRMDEKPRKWFRFNKANELLLITRDKPDGINVVEEFPLKFICVQHEADYSNPYGQGLLDEAYWYAKALAANFEFHISFLEDDGRDHWMGWVPPGSDNAYKDKVEEALRKLRNAAVAVVEEGTRIEKVENKGRTSTSDAFEVFKQSCRTTINMLWLGSDLATNLSGTGSYASSKSGIEIQADTLDSVKELPEQAINTAIRWMQDVNTLPGDADEDVVFYLYEAPANDKEQAEIDEIYSRATGRRPSGQLLTKRGYEEGDWEDPAPAATEAVATFESGYDALFNAVEGLKKKFSPPMKRIS
jgi:hypothetical protein